MARIIASKFEFTEGTWNVAIHKLRIKLNYIDSINESYGILSYRLTGYGFDYLIKNELFKDITDMKKETIPTKKGTVSR